MKTKIIILAIIFLSIAVITNAQPLPPSTPYGNPVPVGGVFGLLLLVLSGLGLSLKQYFKKNK